MLTSSKVLDVVSCCVTDSLKTVVRILVGNQTMAPQMKSMERQSLSHAVVVGCIR